jgi:hypothetical protein
MSLNNARRFVEKMREDQSWKIYLPSCKPRA